MKNLLIIFLILFVVSSCGVHVYNQYECIDKYNTAWGHIYIPDNYMGENKYSKVKKEALIQACEIILEGRIKKN